MGVLSSKKSPEYLQQIRNRVPETPYALRDSFLTPRLPGAVNGTAAEPGPGTRTVVDTGNLLSITDGYAVLPATALLGDPAIRYNSKSREVGDILIFRDVIIRTLNGGICYIGWDNNTVSVFYDCIIPYFGAFHPGEAGATNLSSDFYEYTINSSYDLAMLSRQAGYFWFVKDNDNKWELCFVSNTSNISSYYPGLSNRLNVTSFLYNVGEISIPKKLWLPAPLLSDGFGTVPDVIDYGGVNDGTPTRVGFGGDARKAFFDGTNSFVDIYSADLNNKFNGKEFSCIVRSKVSDVAVWTDGTTRYLIRFFVDANNSFYISRVAANNRIQFIYEANGVVATMNETSYAGEVGWFTSGITGSDTNDQARAYKNGVEIAASPAVNAGVWTGNLTSSAVVIGAGTTAPINVWDGWLSDAILLYGVVATPAQMATMHTHLDAGTLTEQILDAEFGVNNWSWWKLNESYQSDGLGHAEGIAGGIGSGGAGLQWEQPIGAFDINSSDQFECDLIENPGWGNISIAVAECKTQDVVITCDGWAACGPCARYLDEDNLVMLYNNGAGTVVLREIVGGAINVLLSVAAVYVPGGNLRLIVDGQNVRAYYEDVLIGTAVINSTLKSTKHGVSAIATPTRCDNLTIYARGTNGEYEILESF